MLSKKLVILSALYTLLCFVGIMIFAFVTKNIPNLLEIDVFSYRILLGLSYFLNALPSIVAAAFFVIVATYADKDGSKNKRAFSSIQMAHYKQLVLVISINVIVLFCAAEIFRPMINAARVERENKFLDYNWYIAESEESYKADDILSAIYFVDTAITLYPSSQEALDLKEVYERAPAENAEEALQYFPELSFSSDMNESEVATNVLTLLQQARQAFEEQRYFDAHYYAFVALELGGTNNPNSQELQMISLDSWNTLQTWSGFQTNEDMRIFELKRKGYTALIEGDSLSAYYIYLDLDAMIPYDPDVMRYFELSKNALLNDYFFIDETSDLAHFERSKNVAFSVTRSDGLHYEVRIAGITNVKSTGSFLKYLRNYSCTVSDTDGKILYSFSVPYAKLIGQPLSSVTEDILQKLNLEASDLAPRLLLTSVDRDTKGITSAPVFTQGQISMVDDSLTFLPMTLDDFELVLDASAGPQYINLASLFAFLPSAEKYGFSELAYSTYFLQRVSYPFLLFVIFLFLTIQAWNYRLPENTIFRFYWVLVVPMFTLVAEALRQLFSYGMILISFTFARIDGMWQIPAMCFAFFVLIIIFSIRFLSLHSHTQKK